MVTLFDNFDWCQLVTVADTENNRRGIRLVASWHKKWS
jgi:hypothetical protein